MDKQDLEEVVSDAARGALGGYVAATLIVGALPALGFAALVALALAFAYPAWAFAIILGLIAWAWRAGVNADAKRKRQHEAAKAQEQARLADALAPHDGKERYVERTGDEAGFYLFDRYLLRYRRVTKLYVSEALISHEEYFERYQSCCADWIDNGVIPSWDWYYRARAETTPSMASTRILKPRYRAQWDGTPPRPVDH